MPYVPFTRLTRFCLLVSMVVIFGSCRDQPAEKPPASNEPRVVDDGSRDPGVAQVETRTKMPSDVEVVSDDATDADSDDQYRSIIVGTWEDDYQGHRTLTVKKNGTATMVVELEGLAATLYANQMTFDEEWSVVDGRLKLKTVGGEPKGRVNLIINTMGDISEQEILELTPDRMLLLDADGETKYDWRKVPVDNSPTEQQDQQSQ
jgi:hypothetical protein